MGPAYLVRFLVLLLINCVALGTYLSVPLFFIFKMGTPIAVTLRIKRIKHRLIRNYNMNSQRERAALAHSLRGGLSPIEWKIHKTRDFGLRTFVSTVAKTEAQRAMLKNSWWG